MRGGRQAERAKTSLICNCERACEHGYRTAATGRARYEHENNIITTGTRRQRPARVDNDPPELAEVVRKSFKRVAGTAGTSVGEQCGVIDPDTVRDGIG